MPRDRLRACPIKVRREHTVPLQEKIEMEIPQTLIAILTELSQRAVKDSVTLQKTILKLGYLSGNVYQRDMEDADPKCPMQALNICLRHLEAKGISTLSDFFSTTVPQMAQGALALAQNKIPLQRLLAQKPHCVTLSKNEVFAVLSAGFLGVVPPFPPDECDNFNSYNFFNITEDQPEKCYCLLAYFCLMAELPLDDPKRKEKVSYSRAVLAEGEADGLICASSPLLPFHVEGRGCIEAVEDALQADFANKYFGGGALGYGCVQEEIRLAVCPELYVMMLLAEVMADNEALHICGVEQFAHYSGYGDGFTFVCRAPSLVRQEALPPGAPTFHRCYFGRGPVTPSGHRDVEVFAIDALEFPAYRQYDEDLILREVRKAIIGFRGGPFTEPSKQIATGNWGCGVFGGDPQLKSLLQWVAASAVGKSSVYFTFGNAKVEVLGQVVAEIQGRGFDCGRLYALLKEAGASVKLQRYETIFEAIMDMLNRLPQYVEH
uniref:poly(ADP-ribose) glycohydrolase n=1 Tax=Chromera velia CCMP2878 TaxID=1169474 RepID=A0A0G4HY07_9ALVE|eukprot:Cvel_9393.t1-p1 / transcript=Cvel_9393.t1 / gene=Cvel_9393 / organism=Chromera_velia_CCMP2878 / gene_product=Poly(ADP-ribose) glycohydrolase, putative / transcript_product=Poly(ADP-ribose) glycohydrolase, putative / location=Cvel_scaffold539:73169-77104(+) / protein_length=490 / sequence_SO=supercontig / SO=protein_coding / is_pseudo=false